MENVSRKIILVGDASNYHRALAGGLRRLGHEVTVASAGSAWMNTGRDIDLRRRLPGKLGGLDLWLRLNGPLRRRMSGYDIVSVASETFVDLRPERIRAVFDHLRADNGSMFYSAVGNDANYVAECLDPESPMEYNEYRIFDRVSPYAQAHPEVAAAWTGEPLRSLADHIFSTVDGAVSCLWEYDVALRRALPADRIAYGGIPIDTRAIECNGLSDRINKVRLMLGRHRDRQLQKGTDIMEQAARAVVERYPDRAELIIVENRPYDEYLQLMRSSHIVIDQLYSYTPATNALLAMAMGLCTVSGGDERFYRFIGEDRLRPVIHVEPSYDSVVEALTYAVTHPDELAARGREGREFVVKHNDSEVVARRNIELWERRLAAKKGGAGC